MSLPQLAHTARLPATASRDGTMPLPSICLTILAYRSISIPFLPEVLVHDRGDPLVQLGARLLAGQELPELDRLLVEGPRPGRLIARYLGGDQPEAEVDPVKDELHEGVLQV